MSERAVAVTLPYSPRYELDADLIVLYRTAAPVLARQVQAALALCEETEVESPTGAAMVYADEIVRALTEVGE